ncbi:MAG: hydrogenase maturation nickel metallochaperone HypA [Erysipelotrichaceae bacterium]|nr:hydrogenase maturation nickel metallochaperone HypA [Erysipelotrichaceae bacterium]
MHEMGIVVHLTKTLDELAKEKHITRIGSVTLQVGEVSGIINDLFVDAWDYFRKKHPVLNDAELRIEPIKAVTHCDGCGRDYETVKYGRICPYCSSKETWLIEGNECIIKEIEAETADDLAGEEQNA